MTFRQKYEASTTWKERVTTIAIYHYAMDAKNSDWSIKETAAYFSISPSHAGEDLKLFTNMEIVQDCKSRNQALGLLK